MISFLVSFFVIRNDKSIFLDNYHEARTLFQNKREHYNYAKYVVPQWQENTKTIETFFIQKFSFSFLRNQILKRTMFAHLPKEATNIQKYLLKEQYSIKNILRYIRENSVGAPILNDFEFATSGNSIHHFYHIAKFEKEVGVQFTDCTSVVELGGGYGNFAKITKRIAPDITYTIIDIPIFSFIQLVYLRTIFGKDKVRLYDANIGIVSGCINLVPFHEADVVSLAEKFPQQPDVFVSTWALSESNDATQKLMQELDYFKAKYLLIAYQKENDTFRYAEAIRDKIPSYTASYNEETAYLTDNYYLFAKRS